MRLFFFSAFLTSIAGTLMGDLLPSWVALSLFFVPAFLFPKREVLIFSILGSIFVLYPLDIEGKFDILARADVSGKYVKIIAVWDGERWEGVAGGFRISEEGERFYCHGYLKRILRYPGYSFKGKCFAFEYRRNFFEKIVSYSKEKAERFYEEFHDLTPNVVGMVLSKRGSEVYRSGIAHIFAVSGFHIGIVFLIFRLVVQTFTYRFYLVETLPLIQTLMYSISVGLSPSSLRALLMLSLRSVFKIVDYDSNPLNLLGMVGVLSLIFDPYLVYSASFVLSFSATLGILISLEEKSKWYFVPFYAFFYSLPFSLIFFGKVNLISPFLSLVATPVASVGIFGGVLSYTLSWMGFENMSRLVLLGLRPLDSTMGFLMRVGNTGPKIVIPVFWGILLLIPIVILTVRSIHLPSGGYRPR